MCCVKVKLACLSFWLMQPCTYRCHIMVIAAWWGGAPSVGSTSLLTACGDIYGTHICMYVCIHSTALGLLSFGEIVCNCTPVYPCLYRPVYRMRCFALAYQKGSSPSPRRFCSASSRATSQWKCTLRYENTHSWLTLLHFILHSTTCCQLMFIHVYSPKEVECVPIYVLHVCMYVRTYVRMYVCMYVRMYVYASLMAGTCSVYVADLAHAGTGVCTYSRYMYHTLFVCTLLHALLVRLCIYTVDSCTMPHA